MMNYYDLRKKILEADSTLKEAYELKNKFDIFYDTNDIETASMGINPLIQLFLANSIEEMTAFVRTLLHWKQEIINSFHIVKTEYHIDKENGQVSIHKKMNQQCDHRKPEQSDQINQEKRQRIPELGAIPGKSDVCAGPRANLSS